MHDAIELQKCSEERRKKRKKRDWKRNRYEKIKGSVSDPGRKEEGSEENVFQNPWYVNPQFYPGTGI